MSDSALAAQAREEAGLAAVGQGLDQLGRIVFSTGSPEDIPPGIAEMGPIFEKPYDPAELVEALADSGKAGFFARLRGKG